MNERRYTDMKRKYALCRAYSLVSLLGPCLCIQERLIEVLGDVDLVIESQHFLVVFLYLIFLQLVRVPMLVIKFLELTLHVLESDRLVKNLSLKLLVRSC